MGQAAGALHRVPLFVDSISSRPELPRRYLASVHFGISNIFFFFPPSFSKLTLQDTVFWETMCKLIFFHASTAFLLLPLLSFQGLKENTIQILKGYS